MSKQEDLIVVRELDDRYSIVIGYRRDENDVEGRFVYDSEKEALQDNGGNIPCACFVIYDKQVGDWADFAQKSFLNCNAAISCYKSNVEKQRIPVLQLDNHYAVTVVEEAPEDDNNVSGSFAFCFLDLQSGEFALPETRFETCQQAIAYYREELMEEKEFFIADFYGKYAFLNNGFDQESCPIQYAGYNFRTAEGAFQSRKCPDAVELFTDCSGSAAKKAGRSVAIRSDWKDVRDIMMYEVLMAKFSQNDELRQALLDTGDDRIEPRNLNHENYWGSCECANCASKEKHNKLGILLMRVRENLRP